MKRMLSSLRKEHDIVKNIRPHTKHELDIKENKKQEQKESFLSIVYCLLLCCGLSAHALLENKLTYNVIYLE